MTVCDIKNRQRYQSEVNHFEMSVSAEELERVIRQVYQEKPADKFHETERLWEILSLLNVVSDSETPSFFNDILEQEISSDSSSGSSSSGSSSSGSSSSSAKPRVEENKYAPQFDIIKEGIKNITKFTESEQGTNLLNMLPEKQRENLKGSIHEITKTDPLENPLMKMFNNIFGGNAKPETTPTQ